MSEKNANKVKTDTALKVVESMNLTVKNVIINFLEVVFLRDKICYLICVYAEFKYYN